MEHKEVDAIQFRLRDDQAEVWHQSLHQGEGEGENHYYPLLAAASQKLTTREL